MYSYVTEFSLGSHGEESREFLADAARGWPKLWGDILGVTGTLLLCNAFALGGEFEYQWRVDFDTLATLSRIDEVQKAREGGWRKARQEWFSARKAVRGHVSRRLAGSEAYCRDQKGTDAAIHFVFHASSSESGHVADRLDAVRSAPGVVSAQVLRPVIGSDISQEQIWMRLESLDSLDRVAAVDLGLGSGQLFGEMREVDGSFFVGA